MRSSVALGSYKPEVGIAANKSITIDTSGADSNWGTDFSYIFGNRRVITPNDSSVTVYEDSWKMSLPYGIEVEFINGDIKISIGGSIYFGLGGGASLSFNLSEFLRQMMGGCPE